MRKGLVLVWVLVSSELYRVTLRLRKDQWISWVSLLLVRPRALRKTALRWVQSLVVAGERFSASIPQVEAFFMPVAWTMERASL